MTMDPTTKEGREALRLRIKTAMIALAGLCNGTRPMRMSGPSQSDDPDLQIAGGLAVGKDALSHIEKLEAERDELRAEVERLTRVVSYQRARIPAED